MLAPGDQLEELHRELDVADAADALLDIDVGLARPRDLLFQAPLVALDALHERLVHAMPVDELLRHCVEPRPQGGVPGDEARLQQRLPLPRLRPRLVVRPAGLQGPRDRSEAAFGPQAQVHAEDESRAGRFGERVPDASPSCTAARASRPRPHARTSNQCPRRN